MTRTHWIILFLAYIIGLLLTSIFGIFNPHPTFFQWIIVITILGAFSIICAIFAPHFWRKSPSYKYWLSMSLVALLGVIYFQWRIPFPQENNISHLIQARESKTIIVQGKIEGEARINARGNWRFWLQISAVNFNSYHHDFQFKYGFTNRNKLNNYYQKSNLMVAKSESNNSQNLTGKLYVTLPLSEAKKLYPRQNIVLEGILYKPSQPSVPGTFNFQTYLARNNAFAGLRGLKLIDSSKPPWGFWLWRHRIIDSQYQGLGSPAGPLISSMVLGRNAVNLPHDLQNLFTQAGLAYILAASGFHVALLLGIVLFLSRRLSEEKRLILGICILFVYITLTGLQPSVIRAALMGVGGLIGLVLDRKVNNSGSLLLVATILLIFKPLWIWDLGFQLSFLATFGLIVTLPPLIKKLDWLPPTVATIIAVPIAASLWTYPLVIHSFNVIATYGIICSAIVSPLVMVISIGGMVSAAVSLIFPPAGSAIAWLLYYPTHFLIAIVTFFSDLPASSYAVGTLPIGLMVLIYGLFIAVWLHPWFQRHWKLVSLIVIFLVVVPVIALRLRLVQVTVLAHNSEPVVIIQNRGKVILINSGDSQMIKYQLLPFLSQQGINQINCGIDFPNQGTNDNSAWTDLKTFIPIKKLVSSRELSPSKLICEDVKILSLNSLLFTLPGQKWLWVRQAKNPPTKPLTISPQVVLWSGTWIHFHWLNPIQPQTAIAVSGSVSETTQEYLRKRQIELYWTGRDGAIQGNPNSGFQGTLNHNGNENVYETN